ncbi:hypothetical protein EDD17DRAFT_1506058 [Pisolithus thermaeus]|nr:hypothetical protein EDD17DRAFT_1506058 [Pisolithus thermaeus]
MSAFNFFRRPSSAAGHSSTGHSTTSHSSSSATTHSSILTHSTSITQLTQCSTSSIDPAFPPPALTHSRAEPLRSRPGSRPMSFVDSGNPTSVPPTSASVVDMSSHAKRPFPVVRSHSSTPTASPSTYRRSTLNPNAPQRSRTSTNADNWNPLWASVTSTVPTDASKTQVPSKPGEPASGANKSPFGPAEIPRFSRATLKESGIVMPVSAKDWRRRHSVALPNPSSSSKGLDAHGVDKGKGKEREQRISFVDSGARGPRSSQVPTLQVVPADATQPHAHVELKVHPPSPTPDVHPSEPVATPSIVVVKPEIAVTPETEQQTVSATSATPMDESRVLSSKSSTNTFFSCTSDVSNKTPPSPASLPIPPPSPTTSSSLFPSSDTSSEEKSHSAVRPRPRARRQSTPQNMSAGNRLSFVDAMMRLSVGSFRSFATAQPGEWEGDNTSEIERDGIPRDADDNEERAVLARTRSLDDLTPSPLPSPPPSSPDVQTREHMDVEEARAISYPPPARFENGRPRRVTAEWVGGAPRGVTMIPNYTMPSHAGGNGDSQASVVSLRTHDGNVGRVEGAADQCIIRDEVDEEAKAGVPDEGNGREQSVPHVLAQANQPVRQQTQKKRKLTKSRPTSISLSVHRPDFPNTAPTQATSEEPGPGNTPPAVPPGPSTHGAPKLAPTVLSTIVEDGSSHGHGGSSSGHVQEEDRVNANSLPSGNDREDDAARDTAHDTSQVVESIPAKAVPSPVGLMSPKGQVPYTKGDTKETAVIAKVDVSAPSKAGSTPSDVGTPPRPKRYSFLLPVLSFGKSRSKREVRGRDGSPCTAGVTSGTHQAGIGPGDVVGARGKGGKMRKKRDPDASILPAAPKDANVTISESAPDTTDELNIVPNAFASSVANIAALPQSSEITLVASPSVYASPSPGLPFTTVSPPSFGSVPGSAASSIRIPATSRSVNPTLSATDDVVSRPTTGMTLCVDGEGSKTTDDLCLAHRLSHGHLSKDAVLTTPNITTTGEEAIATVNTGHLRPTSALLTPRPGTSCSTLTTSSDDVSFSTVPLPNPWDGDTVPSPVRLVTPEPPQVHRSCPMCGCSSPQLTSRLPVQQFFEPGPTVDTAAAPSPAFASRTSESQVQTPAHPQTSSVPRSFTAPPSHFQPSASPSPCPPPMPTHSPRKLKRPQTSSDVTHKRGSPKKVRSRNGEGNANASASSVYLPVFPKVEREAKARGVWRRLFGNA